MSLVARDSLVDSAKPAGAASSAPVIGGSLVEKAARVEAALDELLAATQAAATACQLKIAQIELLTREETAQFLRLSLSQLDRLTKAGAVPAVWIDRRPRYRASDLAEWLDARSGSATCVRSNTRNKKIMRTTGGILR